MKQTKITLTGSTGGIGTSIANKFLKYKSYSINLLSRKDLKNKKCSFNEAEHIVFAHGTDKEHEMMEANYKLTSDLTKKFILGKSNGRCINICSRQALLPSYDELKYAASKSAIHAEYMAYYKEGYNVTSLCPGWVNTDFQKELRTKDIISIEPTQIADIVKWLIDNPNIRIPYILMEPEKNIKNIKKVK